MSIFEFLTELSQFLSGVTDDQQKVNLGVFATAAAIVGSGIVIIDLLAFYLYEKSYLNLRHSFPKSLGLIVMWGLGSGLGAFIGAAAKILQTTLIGCVTIGVSWPFLLPRLINALNDEFRNKQADNPDPGS